MVDLGFGLFDVVEGDEVILFGLGIWGEFMV